MTEYLLPITHPSPNYRILPPGLFTELQVNRFGALHGHKIHKLVVHSRALTASFRMDAFAFFKTMSLKFFPGKLDGTQLFLQSLKNIFLPSASLPSLSWHRALPDTVFSTHIEDLLTPPIRSLCQLISCFQTIYLFLSQLLFAGSFCLLFLAGSPTQCLGVKLFIFILFADLNSSLSTHAFPQFQKTFCSVLWMAPLHPLSVCWTLLAAPPYLSPFSLSDSRLSV